MILINTNLVHFVGSWHIPELRRISHSPIKWVGWSAQLVGNVLKIESMIESKKLLIYDLKIEGIIEL